MGKRLAVEVKDNESVVAFVDYIAHGFGIFALQFSAWLVELLINDLIIGVFAPFCDSRYFAVRCDECSGEKGIVFFGRFKILLLLVLIVFVFLAFADNQDDDGDDDDG